MGYVEGSALSVSGVLVGDFVSMLSVAAMVMVLVGSSTVTVVGAVVVSGDLGV